MPTPLRARPSSRSRAPGPRRPGIGGATWHAPFVAAVLALRRYVAAPRRCTTHRGRIPLSICAALSICIPCSFAEANEAAAAEALFLEGRRAMDEGRYERACIKFRESHRLEPAAGTAMNLATCEEHLGRLASAWQRWQEALQLLDPADERAPFARQRVAALEGELPYLTVRAAPGVPEGSFFVRNGVRYERGAFGSRLPIDPGEHVIIVGAPHHVPRTYRVEVAPGARRRLQVRPGPPYQRPLAEVEVPQEPTSHRPWAFLCGGAAVAGASTAVVAGLLLPHRQATIDAHCSGGSCDALGDTALRERRQLELARAIGWIVAGAGVGVGTYLFITSREPPPAPPLGAVLMPGQAWVTYAGTF